MGLWPGLALISATAVMIPTLPHDSDVMATGKFCDHLEEEIWPDNPGLRVLGALITRSQPRWRIRRATRHRLSLDAIPVFDAEIPASVEVAAALRSGNRTPGCTPTARSPTPTTARPPSSSLA